MLHFAIPTITVIGYHPKDPMKVAMLKPARLKHEGKPVLCGGKINLATQESAIDAARRKWQEEMGGKKSTINNISLWAVRSDLYAEKRYKKLHEITPGTQIDISAGLLNTVAYYACPDYIFIAKVIGEPAPNDNEAEECFWQDIRHLKIAPTPEESKMGGQHDLILGVYFLQMYSESFSDASQQFRNHTQLRRTLRKISAMID